MSYRNDLKLQNVRAENERLLREREALRDLSNMMIEKLRDGNERLREHSRLVTNKLERKIVELEGEAKEAGEREVRAWAERDQYMRSNVELVAMVERLRALMKRIVRWEIDVDSQSQPAWDALIRDARAELGGEP
jgi:hypothetical protein